MPGRPVDQPVAWSGGVAVDEIVDTFLSTIHPPPRTDRSTAPLTPTFAASVVVPAASPVIHRIHRPY